MLGIGVLVLAGFVAMVLYLGSIHETSTDPYDEGLRQHAQALSPGRTIYWLGGDAPQVDVPRSGGRGVSWEMVFVEFNDSSRQVVVSLATEFRGPVHFCCLGTGVVRIGSWPRAHGETIVAYSLPVPNMSQLRAGIGSAIVPYNP